MQSTGSFPSALPDTLIISSNIALPVNSGGVEDPPPTVGKNGTAATVTSYFTVVGCTFNPFHKTQATFAGLSNTVTFPDLAACFDQLDKTWGDLK